MKTASKIISVALVLVLALSVFMLPASAVDVSINARVTAEQVGVDANGLKIYKMGVYVDSTYSLIAVQLNLTYDNSAFQLVRPNTYANAAVVNANMVIDKADDELAMYDGTTYTTYEGAYMGDNVNADYGYAMFPQDGTQPSLAKISDKNMGDTLKEAGYTGIYWAWMVDVTDNYLLLSGGDVRGTAGPFDGEVKLLTFYLKEKAGAAEGSYEVGFNAEQAYRLTGTYCTTDELDSIIIGPNSASIRPAMVTYSNATINISEEAPALTHAGRQVKMTVENDAVVSGSEQLRVVSSISADDWSTYFANTGVAGATTNAITEIGFVAFKGDAAAYNADTAKDVAQGTDAAGYSRATTNYIQNDTNGKTGAYQFGACIKYETNVYDTTYLAYVKYVDANGAAAYAFYDTATTYSVAFATNYTTITNNYIAWLASQAA